MDTQARSEGGLLGWVATASLPPEVRTVLDGVRPGQVSDPVLSFARWQLFKVFARRPAHVTPLADVAASIRDELTRRRRAAALDEWLGRARAQAAVEVLR
jgi:parvulin-like peptidyl-prolyl isomerase